MASVSNAEAIWGLEDYAVWVPMSDSFYRNLNFRKITLEQFESGDYVPQAPYADSRAYLKPVIEHLTSTVDTPHIFDVGGYIGRFSIEAAIACREIGANCRITCFEPGMTHHLIERNFCLNQLQSEVKLLPFAISDRTQTRELGIPKAARISSRLLTADQASVNRENSDWALRTVRTRPLSRFLGFGKRSFVCKIDTEGHEPNVVRGIGKRNLRKRAHVLVVEFWPQVMNVDVYGEPFDEFILNNYTVINIVSALYPRQYDRITDFTALTRQLREKEITNIDLLLISNNTPDQSTLIELLGARNQTS